MNREIIENEIINPYEIKDILEITKFICYLCEQERDCRASVHFGSPEDVNKLQLCIDCLTTMVRYVADEVDSIIPINRKKKKNAKLD